MVLALRGLFLCEGPPLTLFRRSHTSVSVRGACMARGMPETGASVVPSLVMDPPECRMPPHMSLSQRQLCAVRIHSGDCLCWSRPVCAACVEHALEQRALV